MNNFTIQYLSFNYFNLIYFNLHSFWLFNSHHFPWISHSATLCLNIALSFHCCLPISNTVKIRGLVSWSGFANVQLMLRKWWYDLVRCLLNTFLYPGTCTYRYPQQDTDLRNQSRTTHEKQMDLKIHYFQKIQVTLAKNFMGQKPVYHAQEF